MVAIKAGKELIALIELCYGADRPLMLHGRHGVGKSALMSQGAKSLGIKYTEIDLSLLEPTDLIGLPYIEDKRTQYAVPRELPEAGTKGILMLEELNRCPRYMQAPALQLLTARRLNSYQLPRGWLPCAAINDADDGYSADVLDPALLSRFLNVTVAPNETEWTEWARWAGLHGRIVDFIGSSPGAFEDPNTNPRAWEYASKVLTEWERGARQQSLLTVLLNAELGDKWAVAFIRFYLEHSRPLQPAEIIEAYALHGAALRGWVANCRLDLVRASVELLQRQMQAQRVYEGIAFNPCHKANVESFFGDLPSEFKSTVRAWLAEKSYSKLAVPKNRKKC